MINKKQQSLVKKLLLTSCLVVTSSDIALAAKLGGSNTFNVELGMQPQPVFSSKIVIVPSRLEKIVIVSAIVEESRNVLSSDELGVSPSKMAKKAKKTSSRKKPRPVGVESAPVKVAPVKEASDFEMQERLEAQQAQQRASQMSGRKREQARRARSAAAVSGIDFVEDIMKLQLREAEERWTRKAEKQTLETSAASTSGALNKDDSEVAGVVQDANLAVLKLKEERQRAEVQLRKAEKERQQVEAQLRKAEEERQLPEKVKAIVAERIKGHIDEIQDLERFLKEIDKEKDPLLVEITEERIKTLKRSIIREEQGGDELLLRKPEAIKKHLALLESDKREAKKRKAAALKPVIANEGDSDDDGDDDDSSATKSTSKSPVLGTTKVTPKPTIGTTKAESSAVSTQADSTATKTTDSPQTTKVRNFRIKKLTHSYNPLNAAEQDIRIQQEIAQEAAKFATSIDPEQQRKAIELTEELRIQTQKQYELEYQMTIAQENGQDTSRLEAELEEARELAETLRELQEDHNSVYFLYEAQEGTTYIRVRNEEGYKYVPVYINEDGVYMYKDQDEQYADKGTSVQVELEKQQESLAKAKLVAAVSKDGELIANMTNLSFGASDDLANMIDTAIAGRQGVGAGAGEENEKQITRGLWASGLYGISNQKAYKHVQAYKGKSSGVSIGADVEFGDNEQNIFGIAYSKLNSSFNVKSNKLGNSKVKIDTHALSVYGQTELMSNLTLQVSTSYLKSKGTVRRYHNVGKNHLLANGKFDKADYRIDGQLGYNIKVGNLTFVPNVGLKYGVAMDGGYNESAQGLYNLSALSSINNNLKAVLGLKVAMSNVQVSENFSVTPSVNFRVENALSSKNKAVRVKFASDQLVVDQESAKMKQEKLGYGIGAGVVGHYKNFQLGVNYNCYMVKKYYSHQGTLKLQVKF